MKSSALTESDQTKTVLADSHVFLQCEMSNTSQEASWYKDETELLPQTGVDVQSEGNVQRIAVSPTEQAHIGTYHCELKDDDIQYAAEVKGDSRQRCNNFAVLHG